MADKNLDGNGLSEVWVRAAQLVKKYTGAVDSTKGDLQTQVNEKLSGTDDTKDNTVTFTSADESNPTAWKDVATLDSKEKHSSILNKISNMFSNIRYLYKNVGGIKGLSSSSAITTQGQYALDAREKNASVEGTLANQISNLNSNFDTKADKTQLSNPNLLDNPWFNVNSRGQDDYIRSTNGHFYSFDRWKAYFWNTDISNHIKMTDSGLELQTEVSDGKQNSLYIYQHLSKNIINSLKGRKVTFSSILNRKIENDALRLFVCISNDNGVTYARYKKITPISFNTFELIYISFDVPDNTTNMYIEIGYNPNQGGASGNHHCIIKSVKLELGSISTLHLDSAPDIEQERLKCMLSTADATDAYANKGALTQDLWNSTKTYSAGEYCIWLGILWKCLIENSGVEPVEGDTWTATSIGAELASIISKIDALSA